MQPDSADQTGDDAATLLARPQHPREETYKGPEDSKDSPTSVHSEAVGTTSTTYYSLLRNNRPFRLFFLSYVTNHLGRWFTFLASISALERIYPPDRAKTSVSVLVAVRLLPFVALLPFGGALADGRDKRRSMIVLDVAGACVALLFVAAVQMGSVPLLYASTFLQECISALYEPSRSSIIPLLTRNSDEELAKATYLAGMAWSFTLAFGSALGGFFVSAIGIQACYCVDSATYLLSAMFVACMGGTWDVSDRNKKETGADGDGDGDDNHASISTAGSPSGYVQGMICDGASYLWSSFFGALVLLKPSMEVVCGSGDILNVAFSERGPEAQQAARLGLLFACAGVGCILGPLLTDRYVDLNAPTSVQRLCLAGMAMLSLGCLCMGVWAHRFAAIGTFTAIRAMGASIVWVNSSLLLQKFSAPEMLGRVASIELAVTLLANILSALAGGALVDRAGWTAEQLSLGLSGMGALLFSCWTVYHVRGNGAGVYEQRNKVLEVVNDRSARRSMLVVNELTPLVQIQV